MSAMVSQITSLTIVYPSVYSGAEKHQSSASLAFARGIHRWPVNYPAQKASNAETASIWWRHHGIYTARVWSSQVLAVHNGFHCESVSSSHNNTRRYLLSVTFDLRVYWDSLSCISWSSGESVIWEHLRKRKQWFFFNKHVITIHMYNRKPVALSHAG